MQAFVYQEYRNSSHFKNSSGIRATCPDCHVPRQWQHMMVRKFQASNELFQWLIGSIDTREKFEAKRYQLASHVWQGMRESDSRECRNCHEDDHMLLEQQTVQAKKLHAVAADWGQTCIDCHQGIVHHLPEAFDREVVIDRLHQQIEQNSIACHECHENLKPVSDEEW